MQEQDENTQDTTAETWYNERAARVEAEKQKIEAQSTLVETTYNNLSARYDQLSTEEERAHDALDTRQIVALQEEKTRILNEGNQLREGYTALQQQREQIERASRLDYNTLLETSSQPSQMMLRAYRARLENDPSSMRKLLFEHNRAVAAGITPDTSEYFRHLEQNMGWQADERRTDDFFSTSKPREEKQQKQEFTPSREQLEMSRVLAQHGVPQRDYLAACANPFSQAANADSEVYVDPGESSNESAMSFKVEEPAQPKKYRAPDPKSSVTLSKEEVDLCAASGIDVKEFARNKILLHNEQRHRLTENQQRNSVIAR